MRQRVGEGFAAVAGDRQLNCGELQEVSTDFHAMIRAACPLCQGSGQECLIGKMRGVVEGALGENRASSAVRH